MGIQQVSAYAFALENFKRNPAEISALFASGTQFLLQLQKQKDFFNKYQIQVHLKGHPERLPADFVEAAQSIVETTKNNSRLILNICCAYSSTYEVYAVASGRIAQWLVPVQKCPVDVILRTSGEWRMSNFLIWQAASNARCQTHFVSCHWPGFDFMRFFMLCLLFHANVVFCELRSRLFGK